MTKHHPLIAVLALGLALGLCPGSPLAAQVPAPADVFGFEPGADYEIATHAMVVDYFERLDAASDRVVVERIGTSVQGRPLILAYISSEANIRRLDAWRGIAERLARAEDVEPEEAERLAEEGRAIVWIDGGLHATEVAGAQHTPLLAHRVATEESDEMRKIRENVVLLLMPVMNPDGLDIVASWYERNLGTPFETSDLPWLYHFYIGHDNNRDWFTSFMPESRAVVRQLWDRWYPQIVYNQHQTAPFPARIFTPPFSDPVNPRIPPLVVAGVNLVGDAMHQRFAEEGKPGVVSRISFDMWWNGGMRTAPYFHNQVGILTETALYEYATPHYYEPAEVPKEFGRGANQRADHPGVFYQDPWQGGWWRLRDAVDYMVTGAMATLEIAADKRRDWLYNIWLMGRRSIEAGEAGAPYAYVVPAEQRNPGEAVALVNILRRGGIGVERATSPFTVAGRRYPAGSFIAFAAQAFRPHLLDLLEPQVYPEMRLYPDGPPDPPYDISGWTLPMQMDVRVDRIDEAFTAATVPVGDSAVVAPGSVVGSGDRAWLLPPEANAAYTAVNRLLAEGERVSRLERPLAAEHGEWPAGTFVVRREGRRTAERVAALATELGVTFTALGGEPGGEAVRLEPARVGLYKSWVANMDEGWTRWVLEQYGFAVDTLHDADVRGRDLSGYHAIILPDQDAGRLLRGHTPGTMPAEYVGGLGVEGAAALKRYVEAGGRLVALDAATDFAIGQLGLPVRDATAGTSQERFYIPGSLIRLRVEGADPLGWGMPEETAAVFARSRAFAVIEPAAEGSNAAPPQPVDVIARWADDELLMSGWAMGADTHLAGEAAAVRVRLGAGDVVLFGFRPQFRAQPRGTFKLLFNALLGAGRGTP